MMQDNSQKALLHICERLVRLEDDKAEIVKNIAITKAAAKSDGFDPALIVKTVRLMRMEGEKRKKALEQHGQLDLYYHAVGLIAE